MCQVVGHGLKQTLIFIQYSLLLMINSNHWVHENWLRLRRFRCPPPGLHKPQYSSLALSWQGWFWRGDARRNLNWSKGQVSRIVRNAILALTIWFYSMLGVEPKVQAAANKRLVWQLVSGNGPSSCIESNLSSSIPSSLNDWFHTKRPTIGNEKNHMF